MVEACLASLGSCLLTVYMSTSYKLVLERNLRSTSSGAGESRERLPCHLTFDVHFRANQLQKMDTSSSSDSSFVLVDSSSSHAPLDLSLLASLAPYFPSISSPSAFNWTPARQQEIRAARLARPDQLLFIDNLLALLGHDGEPLSRSTRAQLE